MTILFSTGSEYFEFLIHFFVDLVLVLLVNWLAWTVLVFALIFWFGQFIQRLKSNEILFFRYYKFLMNFLLVTYGSWMTGLPFIWSRGNIRLSDQSFFLFSNCFCDLFSLITANILTVIQFKCRVPLLSILMKWIHPLVKPLIGQIILIMYSGDDIVELEFTFHEDIVFAFSIHISPVNDGKWFKSMLDDRIDIRLWLVGNILEWFSWLCFGFVYFCLGKVA